MENDYKKQLSSLAQEIKDLQAEKRDFETLKKQVGQQNTEYNRLADERNALERSASGQKDEPKKSI
jgi:cell division protein FtsB